jgi:hypothetical protein
VAKKAEQTTQVQVKVVDPCDQAYSELVNSAAEVVQKLTGNTLSSYYSIGQFVDSLLNASKGQYGPKTITNFSKDLYKATGQLLQSSSLYKARNFAILATQAELERLQANNWSWRNVATLYAPSFRPELRNQILRRVSAGEIKQDQVQKAMDELLQITKIPRQTSIDVTKTFAKASAASSTYSTHVTEVIASLDELLKMPTAKQPKPEEILKVEQELAVLEQLTQQMRARLATMKAAQSLPVQDINGIPSTDAAEQSAEQPAEQPVEQTTGELATAA